MIAPDEIGRTNPPATRPADLSSPNAAGRDFFTQAENLTGDQATDCDRFAASDSFLSSVAHEADNA